VRTVFRPKREELKASRSGLCDEEIHQLSSSPNMYRAGRVARMGEIRMHIKLYSANLQGRDHVGDPRVDRKILLKWILRETGYQGVDCIHLAQDIVQ
jgi:hypothetical protein